MTTTTPSDVIDLTNGNELAPPSRPPSPSASLSSLLFSAGSKTRSPGGDTAINSPAGMPSSSPLVPLVTASMERADKGLVYAPGFPNYFLDNASVPHQLYSQYLLNGTSGSLMLDWDVAPRNSLYGDAVEEGAFTTGTTATELNCDDVYVSENGMTYQVTVYCMYIVIFVLALLGNGVVCYIVQSSPRMRTVTNYFICNLAIGDILMTLFCVPFSFISILILGYWPFGVILCHLVNYSQAISVLVSAYTLVAISVDRYIVIMWPLRPRITKRWVEKGRRVIYGSQEGGNDFFFFSFSVLFRYAKCIIAVVWGIALVTAMPIVVVSKLHQPKGWHQNCGK